MESLESNHESWSRLVDSNQESWSRLVESWSRIMSHGVDLLVVESNYESRSRLMSREVDL